MQILKRHNNVNSQSDATITDFIDNYNPLNMFRAIILPILRSCVYSLWYKAPGTLPAGDKDEVEFHSTPVLYITSCKHSLVLLRMGEIIAINMLS